MTRRRAACRTWLTAPSPATASWPCRCVALPSSLILRERCARKLPVALCAARRDARAAAQVLNSGARWLAVSFEATRAALPRAAPWARGNGPAPGVAIADFGPSSGPRWVAPGQTALLPAALSLHGGEGAAGSKGPWWRGAPGDGSCLVVRVRAVGARGGVADGGAAGGTGAVDDKVPAVFSEEISLGLRCRLAVRAPPRRPPAPSMRPPASPLRHAPPSGAAPFRRSRLSSPSATTTGRSRTPPRCARARRAPRRAARCCSRSRASALRLAIRSLPGPRTRPAALLRPSPI